MRLRRRLVEVQLIDGPLDGLLVAVFPTAIEEGVIVVIRCPTHGYNRCDGWDCKGAEVGGYYAEPRRGMGSFKVLDPVAGHERARAPLRALVGGR